MDYSEILESLESLADPKAIEGMARFGIRPERTYGVSIPNLRGIARGVGVNHELAGWLWLSGSRETRILASMIDDPSEVTEAQMERWASDFDYWEICDQVCTNLFQKTAFAWQKAVEWSSHDEESFKRAAFVLISRLAVTEKNATDAQFEAFFPLIEIGAGDERNMVKKAVSWAIRQIGKRNLALNAGAIEIAEAIQKQDSRSAKWVASDALRELRSDAVQQRLQR
ncbi:MAG: DNA alkylation repair protein [Chloroflexota bacterium]|nr:DNA alkylation repair protein [Chloroflexota bacterium]